jgi:formate--tetrahydrofolate ligase
MRSDIEIAHSVEPRPIAEIAAKLGIGEEVLIPYGRHIAKLPLSYGDGLASRPEGSLILVTAMTPTPMGEGKTTTTIGLGQALAKIGKKTAICVREPSLGPCMGVKGGAAGGGYSQVLPMEDINLHFTGDIHAVSTAHNLLSSLIDNHLHQRSQPELNARSVIWRRTMDMNDRSLRSIVLGLGENGLNGVMREDGFDITASSEVMAILCLSRDLSDLKRRLGSIMVGYDPLKKPVFAREIGAQGAMAALLKHAMNPNLVQTIEGVPAFVHGGPFANIAHGCNTLAATRLALRLADYVVTEAGFGADLGAEKFFDIKCRAGGLSPRAAILVVTTRAYAMHGIANIAKHVSNLSRFGVPVAVSVNRFLDDAPAALEELRAACEGLGVPAHITDYREGGGPGGLGLAEETVRMCEKRAAYEPLYPLAMPLQDKLRTIATKIYGAKDVEFAAEARRALKHIEDLGYGEYPVCVAKTQSSLSDDPKKPGCPEGFTLTVRDAKVSCGAEFVVAYTGKIMTMPGLPKVPSAAAIDIDEGGNITGLF